MFGLKVFVVCCRSAGSLFGCDPLSGFRFTGTALFAAFVAPAVEIYAAGADTLGGLDGVALVAEGPRRGLATATENIHVLETGAAVAGVAGFGAFVAAFESFLTGLAAGWD